MTFMAQTNRAMARPPRSRSRAVAPVEEEPAVADATNDPEAHRFLDAVIDRGARVRLPDLAARGHRDALLHLPDRHGIVVLALPTAALAEETLVALLTYRFAQYLAIGFFDATIACAERMEHEPLAAVSPGDVHVVAASRPEGEILAYATLRAPDAPNATVRMRECYCPLLPGRVSLRRRCVRSAESAARASGRQGA